MSHAGLLKGCELHVHVGGCFYVEDLLDLAADVYVEVDWTLFTDSFERAFGRRPDPVVLFRDALAGAPGGRQRLRDHYVFPLRDDGDFGRFMARLNLLISLYRHWRRRPGGEGALVRRIVERHRREGLDYVEYRAMFGGGGDDPRGFLDFHAGVAEAIRDASGDDLQGRYIISIPRWDPVAGYQLVRQLLECRPDLAGTIVGLDLCDFEEGYPPRTAAPLFSRLEEDNRQRPDEALEVVYHVGEIYSDKSLESAVRWCHQAAELGASRLGHAIALGLDPEVAASRGPEAHLSETVGERLDQITYDLEWTRDLAGAGVEVDPGALGAEARELAGQPPGRRLQRPYSVERLEQVRRRQEFVLTRLGKLGTVVETCPTSNRLFGRVPAPAHHPVHRLLASGVNLVIGADDPGIFESPLAEEIDWVCRHTGKSAEQLARRLGDPRRFGLNRLRNQRGDCGNE